jgi:photosystem II stability/assembly factor-like uncharacterized protein
MCRTTNMKKKFYLIAKGIVIVIITFAHGINGQWEQTGGPIGERISPMIVHGKSIFAGSRLYGIHRSDDGGLTWKYLYRGLPKNDFSPYCFAIKRDTIYAGSYRGYLYKSFDNGENWVAANTGFPDIGYQGFNSVLSIAVGDSEMIAALDLDGIFRSVNGGRNWVKISSNINNKSVTIVNGKLYTTNSKGFYYSLNHGSSWGKCKKGLPDSVTIKILYNSSDKLLGASDSGAIYMFNEADTCWIKVKAKTEGVAASGIKIRNDTMFAMVYERGVYRSFRTDTSWFPVNNGLTDMNVNSVELLGDTLLVGTKNGGLFRSMNFGSQWNRLNSGPGSADAGSLAIAGDTIWACIWGNGLSRSIDGGTTWVQCNSGLNGYNMYLDQILVHKGIVYAWYAFRQFMYNIAAEKWYAPKVRPASVTAMCIHNNQVFASTISGLYYTTDQGLTWVRIDGFPSDSLSAVVSNGSTLYISTCRKGIYKSTDNGITWSPENNGLTDTISYSLAINGQNIIAYSSKGTIFHSSNGGSNWIPCNSTIKPNGYCSMTYINNTIFASTYDSGLYLSKDNGDTWFIDSGITTVRLRCTALCGTSLYEGTEAAGVWKRPLYDFVGKLNQPSGTTISNSIIKEIVFNQMEKAVTFHLILSEETLMTLCVYNISGQKIASILKKRMMAGKQSIRWRTNAYSAGTYILRVKSGIFEREVNFAIY